MTVHWLLLDVSALPDTDDWLGRDEKEILKGLRFPKRRGEWKLGRYTAKRALSSYAGVEDLARIEVIAAKDGAPEAFIDGRSVECAISISHREGVAACVLAQRGAVGCDLEAIEPRTTRFVNDFFTERERDEVETASDELRDLRVALTWSAKESTLKALRVGLRRDTRSVEIQLAGLAAPEPAWRSLQATLSPEAGTYRGWWRRFDGLVLTVLGDELAAPEAHPERLGKR